MRTHDDPDEVDADDLPEPLEAGYAWSVAEQEERLPGEEYRLHMAILDDLEEEELEHLDLDPASDYILWAAAQAHEDLGRMEDAIAILKRIAGSGTGHPALYYPDLLLRLADLLRERGDYDEALRHVERAAASDPETAESCREKKAEILVLMGRLREGLGMFEQIVREAPDDPWAPLTAAWALLQRGDHDGARVWAGRADRALRNVEDEAVARDAATEVQRLREEIDARARRRSGGPGLEGLRERILAALDQEEIRLVGAPPRDEAARVQARERLEALHARASDAWDDAVEARDETLIAAFDDLQGEIEGLAERFGVALPEPNGD